MKAPSGINGIEAREFKPGQQRFIADQFKEKIQEAQERYEAKQEQRRFAKEVRLNEKR